jgi:hypothetical protein
MTDQQDFTHGPGEDVIDPAAGLLGWLAIGLLAFMALSVIVVLSAAALG